jgi:beta-glucanase (GH16 family)
MGGGPKPLDLTGLMLRGNSPLGFQPRANLNPAGGPNMTEYIPRLVLKTTLAALVTVSVLAVPRPAASAQGNKGGQQATAGWLDDFSSPNLNKKFWVIASGQAPGRVVGYHIGTYDSGNVKVVTDKTGSYMRLLLTQQIGTVDTNPSGVVSHGALVYTKNKYGYGTYEMRMRMSSTSSTPNGSGDSVSGSVSAGFAYVNNSQTEIDFEFSGLSSETLYMVNWLNPNPQTDPTGADETFDSLYPFSVSTAFHDYKFVWQPGQITFYVDGVVRATHTTNVPSAPANFMINHWGTDSGNWGGTATVGTSRYFYVDWVKYTPLP